VIEGMVGRCIKPIAPLVEGHEYQVVMVHRRELFNAIDMVEVKDISANSKIGGHTFFPWRFRF
jgi:hypothetical protein